MAKPFSSVVTVSDACLTGTATCSLVADPKMAQGIASTRELWRYKGKCATVKARDAIKKLDPFTDIQTAIDCDVFEDPFQLNESFENVPEALACSEDWRLLFSSQMRFKEHITLLEGRAAIQSIRHLTRSTQNFNQRHLHLGDNLGMVLAFDRGRAKSVQLLFCCRKACAYSVASGCSFSHRWIPSEFNAADGPSRLWEKSSQETLSKTQCKKIRDSFIYPKAGKGRPGNGRWADHLTSGDSCLETGSAPRSSISHRSPHARVTTEFAGKGFDRQDGEEVRFEEGLQATPKVLNANNTGGFRSFPKHSPRLLQAKPRFSELLQSTGIESHGCFSGRPCLDRIPESSLLRGVGHFRGKQVLCSSARVLSNSRFCKKQKGFEGMAKSRSRTVTDSTGLAPCSLPGHDSHAVGKPCSSPVCLDHVHNIHAAVRSNQAQEMRSCQIIPPASELDSELECPGRRQSVKGGSHRRDPSFGQPCDAISRTSIAEAGARRASQPTFWAELPKSSSGLAPGSCSNRPGARLCSTVSAEALRGFMGSSQKTSQHPGHKTPGPLVSRQQFETVRKSCKGCANVREAASSSTSASRGIPTVVEGDGYKVFYPLNPNSKKPILEVFAGCAAFSKSLCRLGFTVHAYDIQWGAGGDILNHKVFRKLCNSIKAGYFSFVFFGMPCDSWSRARKWDGGPQPLRDDGSHLYGFSNLKWYDSLKVQRGNDLLAATFRLAWTCVEHQIPWTLENPATSRAWLTKEMRSLEARGAFKQLTHYCQYGKSWRKATIFFSWQVPNFHLLQCSGSHGQCNTSGKRHFVLQGRNSQGVFYILYWLRLIPLRYVITFPKCSVIFFKNTPLSGLGEVLIQ